ncbi:hypothetical protein [Jiulongibacter sp. NS-SX5]|uniref:hypothetical protein n=1 Tax=Jiulongibacter sp. NS-SX5 TaxID=3463854 RepID=UPI00405A2FBD
MNQDLFPEIRKTIIEFEEVEINEKRKVELAPLINYLREKLIHKEPLILNFIGVNNSHRSIIAQIWAETLGHYFNIDVRSFSGGFDSVSLSGKAIEGLRAEGFELIKRREKEIYFVLYSDEADPIAVFAKKVDDPINPPAGYIAISINPEVKKDELSDSETFFDFYPDYTVEQLKELANKVSEDLYYIFKSLGSAH